jgi:signal transduction histidine kinase
MLTNATKYAINSEVRIKLISTSEKLTLYYNDNGPGFEKSNKSLASMGIMNIFERAKLTGGKANLDSVPGQGTSWEISFPLSTKKG